jgi:hypothetical protein
VLKSVDRDLYAAEQKEVFGMVFFGILDESEAEELLRPIASSLRASVEDAFTHYKERVAPVLPGLVTPTTRANVMHDLIVDQLRLRWPDHVFEAGKRWLLRIASDVVMQVKKLDEDRLPCNYPTRKAVTFARQEFLAEMPPATRLTLGYRLNDLRTELAETTVLCQGSVHYARWYYDLQDSIAPIKQLILPVSEPKLRRLRAKVSKPKSGKAENDS